MKFCDISHGTSEVYDLFNDEMNEIGRKHAFNAYFADARFSGYRLDGFERTEDETRDVIEFGRRMVYPDKLPFYLSRDMAVYLFRAELTDAYREWIGVDDAN